MPARKCLNAESCRNKIIIDGLIRLKYPVLNGGVFYYKNKFMVYDIKYCNSRLNQIQKVIIPIVLSVLVRVLGVVCLYR